MDRGQLRELRREVEEEYKLDIAAIERLQRRFPHVELRREVEEEYKLDIAAIEWLQRRFPQASVPVSSDAPNNAVPPGTFSPAEACPERESGVSVPGSALPPPPTQTEQKSEELVSSLRTMFNIGYK